MKTLIIYASTYGTTELCAKQLSSQLKADVCNIHIESNPSIEGYDQVILGSSIYISQIDKKLKKWTNDHESSLLTKRLGLFVCCGVDENKDTYFSTNFSPAILEHARVKESFGGLLDESKMTWSHRMITKMVAKAKKEDTKTVLFESRIQPFAQSMLEEADCSVSPMI